MNVEPDPASSGVYDNEIPTMVVVEGARRLELVAPSRANKWQ